MHTIHPVSAGEQRDPLDTLLSGLFLRDVAPWLRELRFKRLSDPENHFMTVSRIGYGFPAPRPKTRG